MLFPVLLFLHSWTETRAINPGCECILFKSTFGKEYGTFSSPDYPKPYGVNINCLLYTFITGPEKIVEIVFKDFDVRKTHLDCVQGDYLKVYLHLENGEVNEYTPSYGVLCGGMADISHMLYSSSSGLVLAFHSSSKTSNATGFFGHFRFIDRKKFRTDGQRVPGTPCDYQFLSTNHSITHGKFYSPRYPSNYPKSLRCNYRFFAQQHERIRVIFEEVALQKGDISCLNRADVIKVHDGGGTQSPVIAVICNEVAAVEVLSTGTKLLIEFVSNGNAPGQGFSAAFYFEPIQNAIGDFHFYPSEKIGKFSNENEPSMSATTSLCDKLFRSDVAKNGTFASPSYPNPYPPGTRCRYDFQGRGNERVQILFSDLHLYHAAGTLRECDSTDSLSAFALIEGRMEKIDSFCGNTLPKPIMSNGPRLSLEFNGQFSSRLVRGFSATYIFTEDFGMKEGKQLTEYPCAFLFKSSDRKNGTFYSPNFPGLYPRNTECHYFFNGEPHEKIHFHFSYFDVEGVLPCESISASDYVELSNYNTIDRKYARHCGHLTEFHVESDRKFFRVTFRSNDRLDATGFRAFYQFLDQKDTYSNSQTQYSRTLSFPSKPFRTLTYFVIVSLLCLCN